jgi:hypothetical protein
VADTIVSAVPFQEGNWHDCHIWGIEIRAGEPEDGDWTSDLVLRLDYIEEWLCDAEGRCRFRVAPAELVFHGVTDLHLAVDCSIGGHQAAIHELSIDLIEREPLAQQRVFLDRPYYAWRLRLNWPAGGEISFGAFGYTQHRLGPGIESPEQRLTLTQRRSLAVRRPPG